MWSLNFSVEGDILASGSHDGTVKLWDIKTLREQVLAKEKEDEDDKVPDQLASNMAVDDKNTLANEAMEEDGKESDDEEAGTNQDAV